MNSLPSLKSRLIIHTEKCKTLEIYPPVTVSLVKIPNCRSQLTNLFMSHYMTGFYPPLHLPAPFQAWSKRSPASLLAPWTPPPTHPFSMKEFTPHLPAPLHGALQPIPGYARTRLIRTLYLVQIKWKSTVGVFFPPEISISVTVTLSWQNAAPPFFFF